MVLATYLNNRTSHPVLGRNHHLSAVLHAPSLHLETAPIVARVTTHQCLHVCTGTFSQTEIEHLRISAGGYPHVIHTLSESILAESHFQTTNLCHLDKLVVTNVELVELSVGVSSLGPSPIRSGIYTACQSRLPQFDNTYKNTVPAATTFSLHFH